MRALVLDTTVLIDALRGRPAAARLREHAARGITLHQADCLIGAVTAGIGARLATGNTRHFPMPELTVEEWSHGT